MSWLLLAAAYWLLLAAYGLGHELGYRKGRREARLRVVPSPEPEVLCACGWPIDGHARRGLAYWCRKRQSWAPVPREMFPRAEGPRASGVARKNRGLDTGGGGPA